jgi:C-terminal processing protease CtpA/Prc
VRVNQIGPTLQAALRASRSQKNVYVRLQDSRTRKPETRAIGRGSHPTGPPEKLGIQGSPATGGIEVISIARSSLAQSLPIEQRDVIEQVNDVSVRNSADLHQALLRRPGSTHIVARSRSGAKKDITVIYY